MISLDVPSMDSMCLILRTLRLMAMDTEHMLLVIYKTFGMSPLLQMREDFPPLAGLSW